MGVEEPRDLERDAVTAILNGPMGEADRVRGLLPLVYGQLRGAAQAALSGERPDHTLQATALVHEAYVRLVGQREMPWSNRAHFYVAAAEAMRRILIDHARARRAVKRGGDRRREPLVDVMGLAEAEPEAVEAVDRAVDDLERSYPELAMVVRLRFYAGLSIEQVAAATGLSPRNVSRHWAVARAILFRALESAGAS